MNKTLKTLLAVSAISLSVSACAGTHGKDRAVENKQCKISKNLENAKTNANDVLKDLDAAAANAQNPVAKKKIGKLIKEADHLSSHISKVKEICEAQHNGEAPAHVAKHKKAKAAKKAEAAAVAPAKSDAK